MILPAGTKVRIKTFEQMLKGRDVDGDGDILFGDAKPIFLQEMSNLCGKITSIKDHQILGGHVRYHLKHKYSNGYVFIPEMFDVIPQKQKKTEV